MSGIAGIVQFDGAPVAPDVIEAMSARMAHRGPDRTGCWVRGPVGFGHVMLCTTPESLTEIQPLANEDETLVLVLDGRVDNRDDLASELAGRGIALCGNTDAEFVLRCYEAWGEDCPRHIVGEFVFFVWDARHRKLFAARDAVGVRHFYYHEGKGWFGFASEIKGLLATGRIQPELNESRMLDYLVPAMDRDDEVSTFYQGILRLPAGHCLSASGRGVRCWRYWDPAAAPASGVKSLDECAEGLREHLRVAVRCRLRHAGPVGAMLSGGLDSSSIVCLIRKEFRGELNEPLRTFSLVQADRDRCAEWPHVQEIMRGGWIEPHIISSDLPDEICAALVERFGEPDEPFCWSHGLPYYLVINAARAKGCRVLLEGMAGDLLFFSDGAAMSLLAERLMLRRMLAEWRAYRWHGLKGGARDAFRSLAAAHAPAFFAVLNSSLEYHAWRRRRTPDERRTWYMDWLLTTGSSAAEVRLFALGGHFREAWQSLRRTLRRERVRLARRQALAQVGAGASALSVAGAAMVWMAWRTVRGLATLGELALFYQAFQQGLNLMRGMLEHAGQLYANMLFLGNLFEFLDLKPAVTGGSLGFEAAQRAGQAACRRREPLSWRFERVTFRYPGAAHPALRDFSLEIPAGRITAIVGSNGAGKSTLIKLLCRFYDPESGRIVCGGRELREWPLEELRRSITVLFQEPVHYSETASRNIALGDLAADPGPETIGEAARAAGADQAIARLPQGYRTLLGRMFADGAELSAGEWQRVALARAFLRRAPMIVLDEPTSSMDPWAEADWLKRFRELASGRTALIITHRFTTAMTADVIHVMDAGRIVESGSHSELLALGGRYSAGWEGSLNGRLFWSPQSP